MYLYKSRSTQYYQNQYLKITFKSLMDSIVETTVPTASHGPRRGTETEQVDQTQSMLEGKLLEKKKCNISERQLQTALEEAGNKAHKVRTPEEGRLTHGRQDFKSTFKSITALKDSCNFSVFNSSFGFFSRAAL